MRLMVISPSKVFRRGVHNALRGEKHLIEEIDTGAAALRRLRNETFDMLLLDAALHEMTGIDFLDQLYTLIDEDQRSPLLYFSAQATYDEVLDAMERGVDDFIVIPFENEVLRKKLTRQVKRRAEADARRRAELVIAPESLSVFVQQPQVVPLSDLFPSGEMDALAPEPLHDPIQQALSAPAPDDEDAMPRYKRRITVGV